MKPVLTSIFLAAQLSGVALLLAGEPPAWKLDCASGAAVVKNAGGAEVLRYFTTKPEGSAFSANSTCCFHPFTTPAGHAVTAFAPDDHKHHRGIFLAWVEMHGPADADFWGWGAHAPVQDRVIIGRALTPLAAKDGAVSFVAAIISFSWQYLAGILTMPILPLVILSAVAFFWWYADRMRDGGVLS